MEISHTSAQPNDVWEYRAFVSSLVATVAFICALLALQNAISPFLLFLVAVLAASGLLSSVFAVYASRRMPPLNG